MEAIKDAINHARNLLETNVYAQAATAATVAIVGVVQYSKLSSKRQRAAAQEKWNAAGKNVVVLHMPLRSLDSPNPSPFPIKLETWLRMNNIKYIEEFDYPQSEKSKTPWITVNGVNVADSQFAIDHLKKELGIDVNSKLSDKDKGVATSVRLVLEEHYYFIIGTEAYVHQDSEHIFECYPPELTGAGTLPKPVLKFIFKHMLRYGGMNTFLNMIGWGRHSVEIQRELGMKSLESVSRVLGSSKYILGDEPCDEDCCLFAFVTYSLHNVCKDNVYRVALRKRFPNLVEHYERMKEVYWKDWDEKKYKK